MGIYSKSDKVKLYPSAYRGSGYDPESRLNTEFNIRNFTKSVIDFEGFVIDYNNATKNIKFNLGGYYFDVVLEDSIFTYAIDNDEGNGDLFVGIKLKDLNSEASAKDIKGSTLINIKENAITTLDDKDDLEFKGIMFSAGMGDLKGYDYKLHLLTGISDSSYGRVPSRSLHKLDATSIRTSIDTNITEYLQTTSANFNEASVNTLTAGQGTINHLVSDTIGSAGKLVQQIDVDKLNGEDVNIYKFSAEDATITELDAGYITVSDSFSVNDQVEADIPLLTSSTISTDSIEIITEGTAERFSSTYIATDSLDVDVTANIKETQTPKIRRSSSATSSINLMDSGISFDVGNADSFVISAPTISLGQLTSTSVNVKGSSFFTGLTLSSFSGIDIQSSTTINNTTLNVVNSSGSIQTKLAPAGITTNKLTSDEIVPRLKTFSIAPTYSASPTVDSFTSIGYEYAIPLSSYEYGEGLATSFFDTDTGKLRWRWYITYDTYNRFNSSTQRFKTSAGNTDFYLNTYSSKVYNDLKSIYELYTAGRINKIIFSVTKTEASLYTQSATTILDVRIVNAYKIRSYTTGMEVTEYAIDFEIEIPRDKVPYNTFWYDFVGNSGSMSVYYY